MVMRIVKLKNSNMNIQVHGEDGDGGLEIWKEIRNTSVLFRRPCMADVCWSALRGRRQFVVESVGVFVVGCYISVVLC